MRGWILSFGGVGWLKPAPGTWGSLAAFPVGWLVYWMGGPYLLVLALLVLFFIGLRAIEAEIASGHDHDPSWVVIDEVVGQWIALLPVAFGAFRTGLPPWELWPGLVAGFLLFRLFDIWKPWLVGRADRRGDAMGVMLDDVWAGIFAAICVVALAALAHAGFVAAVPDQ